MAALLALLGLALARGASAQCNVAFDILPEESVWNVGGTVRVFGRGNFPLTQATPQGRLFLNTPGTCAATPAALAAELPQSSFITQDAEALVSMRMWPSTIGLNKGTYGTITIRSLELALTSDALAGLSPVPGQAQALLQGDVAGITNTITGGIYRGAAASVWRLNPVDSKMPPTTSVSGSSATLVQAGPNRARLALTGLMFEHEFSYNLGNGVTANMTLNGTIVADAVLGCGRFCGFKGTCVPNNGSVPGGAATVCQCDCGWSGNDCSVPSGFCDAPVSMLLPGNTSSITDERAAVQCRDTSSSEIDVCSVRDAATGGCAQCYPGLAGPTCGVCQDASGCAVLQPDLENPICDRNVTYSKDTLVKTYSCDPSAIAGGGIVAPGLTMQCNKTSIAGLPPMSLDPDGSGPFVDVAQLPINQPETPGSSGGTCDLQFRVNSDLDKPVMCLAWGCQFEDGLATAQCLKLRCECPNPEGCPEAIGPILPQLTERAGIVCDPNDPRNPDATTVYCVIDIDGLPLELEAPCVTGECMDPEFNGTASGTDLFRDTSTKKYTFAISAIPIAVAVALGVLLLAVTIPRMVAVMRGVAAVKTQHRTIASGGAWRAHGETRPSVLVFENISLKAPPPSLVSKCLPGRGVGPSGGSAAPQVDATPMPEPGPVGEASETYSEGARGAAMEEGRAASDHGASNDLVGGMARKKYILRNVTSEVASGEILGLMGASGAGKTSLLAILSRQPHLLPKGSKPYGSVRLLHADGDGKQAGGAKQAAVEDSPPRSARYLLTPARTASEAARMQTPPALGSGGGGSGGGTFRSAVSNPSYRSSDAPVPTGPPQPTRSSRSPGPVGEGVQAEASSSSSGEHIGVGAADATPLHRASLGFVQQHDVLMPTLTVTETILFGMMFREHVRSRDTKEAAATVASLLADLGLQGCAHRLVGGGAGISGISGGERRRVSIALELSARPHVLFLDEPTSGLDSYTAHRLMVTLKEVAVQHQRVLITSIHQPSTAIFSMLDRLLLLAHGAVVYSGASRDVDASLARAGLPPPADTPTADWLLAVVNETDKMDRLVQSSAAVHEGRAAARAAPLDFGTRLGKRSSTPWLYQLGILVWRGLLDVFRNPSMVLTTWLLALLFGVFCGLVFWDLELTIAGIQNRAGALFFCLVFLGFLSVTSIDSLLSERLVVNKEQRLGYYPAALYMVAKCLLDSILLRAVPAVIFSVPVYFMARLQRDSERFMLFLFVMIAFTIAAQFQAMLIVEFTTRAGNAMVFFVLILIVQMLFAGFLVNGDSVNAGIRWIRNVSLYYYAWEAVAINEFEDSQYRLAVEGLGALDNVDGDVIAQELGIDMGNKDRNVIVVIGWAGGLFAALIVVSIIKPHVSAAVRGVSSALHSVLAR